MYLLLWKAEKTEGTYSIFSLIQTILCDTIMKFKPIEKNSLEDKKKISLIIGVKKGQYFLLAKRNRKLEWILYYNVKPESFKKENFVRIQSLSSLDEVLHYFQSKDLKPFCPEQQIVQPTKTNTNETSTRSRDRRRYFRKKVSLNGKYQNSRTGRSGELLVKDISFNGVKFTTIGFNGNQIGDKLHLSFTLDNTHKSLIRRKAQIKHMHNHDFGAEFISPPEYDRELGFYLWICHG